MRYSDDTFRTQLVKALEDISKNLKDLNKTLSAKKIKQEKNEADDEIGYIFCPICSDAIKKIDVNRDSCTYVCIKCGAVFTYFSKKMKCLE